MELTDPPALQIAAINSSNTISISSLSEGQSSSSLLEEIQEIVKKVNTVALKKSNQTGESASKLEKRPSTKQNESSPLKSNSFSKFGSNQKRSSQPKLIALQGSSSFLDSKDTWKIE